MHKSIRITEINCLIFPDNNFVFSYPLGSISTIKNNKGNVKYLNSIKLVGTKTKLVQNSQRINFIAFSREPKNKVYINLKILYT